MNSPEQLPDRIIELENTVSDLKDALDLTRQEHQNELDELRSKVDAIESYREEQLTRAIAQHQLEALSALREFVQRYAVTATGEPL